MKFTFETGRTAAPAAPPVTGAVIRSPLVMPEHAEQLRVFRALNQEMMTRTMEAAVSTPYNADFRGEFGSGNAQALTGDYATAARTRTLTRDDPHAKAGMRALQNNVVGHKPFRLTMHAGTPKIEADKISFEPNEPLNRVVQMEWNYFCKSENFTVRKDWSFMEVARMLEAASARDGRAVVMLHKAYPHNKYGFAIDVLESDRLQSSYMGKAPNGNPIRFSIEFDQTWGFHRGVWLLSRHPGDVFGYCTAPGLSADGRKGWRDRIPTEIGGEGGSLTAVVFNNLRDRAETDIGITEYDCTVQALHRHRQYSISLCYAAISSCCKPFWIKKAMYTGLENAEEAMMRLNGGSGPRAPLGNVPPQDGGLDYPTGARIPRGGTAQAPAQTIVMNPGEDLMQTDPRFPVEAAHEFRQDNLKEAAAGLGVSYAEMSGDHQNMGLTAARNSTFAPRDNYRVRQVHHIDSWILPVFKCWLESSIMAGVFDRYDVTITLDDVEDLVEQAHFQGRRWPTANPLQDYQGLIMLNEAGFISEQQVQDQLEDGLPLDVLYSQKAEAKAKQEMNGLDFSDVDVTKPTISKGEPNVTVPDPDDQSGTPQPQPKTGGKQTIHKSAGVIVTRRMYRLARTAAILEQTKHLE